MEVFIVRKKAGMEGAWSLSGYLEVMCTYPIVIYD